MWDKQCGSNGLNAWAFWGSGRTWVQPVFESIGKGQPVAVPAEVAQRMRGKCILPLCITNLLKGIKAT
jgi:hypothetical protein